MFKAWSCIYLVSFMSFHFSTLLDLDNFKILLPGSTSTSPLLYLSCSWTLEIFSIPALPVLAASRSSFPQCNFPSRAVSECYVHNTRSWVRSLQYLESFCYVPEKWTELTRQYHNVTEEPVLRVILKQTFLWELFVSDESNLSLASHPWLHFRKLQD